MSEPPGPGWPSHTSAPPHDLSEKSDDVINNNTDTDRHVVSEEARKRANQIISGIYVPIKSASACKKETVGLIRNISTHAVTFVHAYCM